MEWRNRSFLDLDIRSTIVPLGSLSIYLCTIPHYVNGGHPSKLFNEVYFLISQANEYKPKSAYSAQKILAGLG